MSDFIKRDDAIEKINSALKRVFVEDIGQEIIASIPPADVAPVRHGRWIEQQKEYRIYGCSECNKVTLFEKWGDTVKPYDYCPNCGARMDEEKR